MLLKVPHSAKEAISTRAKVQYVATTSRPDLASATQLLTGDVKSPDSTTLERLSEIVKYAQRTSGEGLRFVDLDQRTLKLVLFTDSSFGNGKGFSSQAGFLIVLMDGNGSANVLHYGSRKCRRVTRSVMAAEILALVNGFDNAFVVKHILGELLDRSIPLDAFIGSRTTFNCAAKHASTLEKRLQIDVSALRESLTRGELRCIGWIPGIENPADGLAKASIPKSDHPLRRLMMTNKLLINPDGWSETG